MRFKYPILPHVLVLCWLAYVGMMVWQHAAHSVQTPLYDPLEYLQKAMNFWRAVDDGKIADAFKVAPLVRPHGTIVMSYPFGFTPAYGGYFFRSIFLPVLLLAATVYVAAGPRQIAHAGWWTAA